MTLKKIWIDPVWSKVIAAGIVGGLGIALVSYQHWWSLIWIGIAKASAYLGGTTPVRRWVYGLLILLAALFVMLLISLSATLFPTKKNPYENLVPVRPPDWQSYTSDKFFGLKWHWRYDGGEILLNAFCPHCDYQVFPDDAHGISGRISFFCDSCNRNVATVQETWDSIRSKVIRFIQQKIRTGAFPKPDNPNTT